MREIRITTWNVNGIRAVARKGALQEVVKLNSDILCLQEIKARPEQLEEKHHTLLAKENVVWHPAERPGYSGVATFSEFAPTNTELGWGNKLYDVEGRVIRMDFDKFILYNIYFPNGQRDHGRLQYKLDFYEELLWICDELHQVGKKIVICGDFNTAHREIDLRNPSHNKNTSGFLPIERKMIDTYLAHGFVDAYRHLYPDKVEYTWWTYITNARARNVGWRLDYFLVSEGIMGEVEDVIVHNEIMGSDHCPVELVIKVV
jgi:exodeoxyribonuclease-3